jgi:hypothetical protein
MALAFTDQRRNNNNNEESKQEEVNASGAVTRNSSVSDAGVETVLQVPPTAALVEEPCTTNTPMGMGGKSVAVEKATRAHRRRTKIISVVPFD